MRDTPIKELARGRWRSLLPILGIDSSCLTGKHVPCPMCGGKDRFRFTDDEGRGRYICNACGAGDGFMLAEKVTGKSFRELADLVRQNVGAAPQVERPKIDEVAQQNAIRSLWASSWQPSQVSPVGIYQTIRLGRPWASKSIREASYGGLPAMLAKIDGVDGKGVNLHLTHLTEDGQKADVEPGKRVMPGKLPDGCAIRLWPAAERMGVAEGIESAMSAAILFKMPVWATINGTMMAKWVPPEEAKEIWIFGDNDGNYTGQAKAYALAHRLSVQFGRLVEVRIPEGVGEDWNDVLKSGRGPY